MNTRLRNGDVLWTDLLDGYVELAFAIQLANRNLDPVLEDGPGMDWE